MRLHLDLLRAYWTVGLWGAAMVISWVGWGTLAARAMHLQHERHVDWGLRAGWGMAVTLMMGGLMLLLDIATAAVLQLQVILGVGIFGWFIYRDVRRCRAGHATQHALATLSLAHRSRWRWWYAIPCSVAIVQFLGTVQVIELNFWDDLPAYLVFVHKIMDTGTLIDPFSWRRLSTYGGQQYLQAAIVSTGNDLNAHFLEQGLCPLMLLGLLIGMFPREKKSWWWMFPLLALLAITVDVPRINIQSQLSGAVLFLTLYRTLRLHRAADRRSLGLAIMAGIVAAAAATLRMNYLPTAVLAPLLAFIGGALLDRRRWGVYFRSLTACMLAILAALFPWALMLYQSSRSLFYPLMRGNQQPEFDAIFNAPLSFAEHLRWSAGFLGYWKFLLLAVPLLLVLRRRSWRDALPLYLAALAGTLAMAWAFTMSDYENIYRYGFPMLFPACLVALTTAMRRRPGRAFAIAVLVGAVLLAVNAPGGARRAYQDIANAYQSQFIGNEFVTAEFREDYQAAQNAVPPHARIYSMASLPSLFEFGRNDIWSADAPGVATPDGPMPVFQDGETFARYLRAQGIAYIIASNFDLTAGMYARSGYRDIVYHPDRAVISNRPDLVTAKFLIATMERIDELAKTHRLVWESRYLRVIHVDP